MAYLQARAGIMRAGVTYAGWTPPLFNVTVAGADLTPYIEPGLAITDNQDRPATARIPIREFGGIAPVKIPRGGQAIRVYYATPNRAEFTGTILRATATVRGPEPSKVVWLCECLDDWWLMDLYALVTKRYRSQGFNSIVADILATFTDPMTASTPSKPFRVGAIDQSLGNINAIDFTFETVSTAIRRLAAAANCLARLDSDRCVSFYPAGSAIDGNALTVADGQVFDLFSYSEDVSQARTRIDIRGRASSMTLPASLGSTVLAVDDVSPFKDAGGQVVVGQNLITYTGRSVASGAGSLTGCSGIAYDIAAGEPVQIFLEVDDPALQTALFNRLVASDGASGRAIRQIVNAQLSSEEATFRASTDLARVGVVLNGLGYRTTKLYVLPGKPVSVTLTRPIVVSGTFRVQTVITTVRTRSKTAIVFWREVTTTPYRRYLSDLLL